MSFSVDYFNLRVEANVEKLFPCLSGIPRKRSRASKKWRKGWKPIKVPAQTRDAVARKAEDKECYRSLPDPFCRYCKKRKPCDC